MSVRRLRIAVAVVALGFVLALALGSAGLLGGGKALGSSTALTVIGGDVTVRHGAAAAYVAAVDGEVLTVGDGVRTGSDGRAVLTYFEGSTVTIEPATELVIDAATTQGSNTIVQMTQNAGRTWHVVTKLVTGDSKYEVRTPASTASVRGTAFTVDTDGTTTTITATEGTVMDQVPDPKDPGKTIDVPVRAGQQHQQQRGQGTGPTQNAPEPERKVTITLSEENTIVIDTAGRANGIDKNGRLLLQTPGATLSKVDGHLVITLPNIPDGRLQALSRKAGGGDVDVETVVEEKGKSAEVSHGKATTDGSGEAHSSVDIGGKSEAKASPTPKPTGTATPAPTEATSGKDGTTSTNTSAGQSGNSGGNSGGGSSGSDRGNSGNSGNGGNGNGGQGGPDNGRGFVPTPPQLVTPLNPSPSPTPAPTPTQHGNSPGTGGGTNTGSGNNGSGGSGGGGQSGDKGQGNGGSKKP